VGCRTEFLPIEVGSAGCHGGIGLIGLKIEGSNHSSAKSARSSPQRFQKLYKLEFEAMDTNSRKTALEGVLASMNDSIETQ
jgi:hypothetical protein